MSNLQIDAVSTSGQLESERLILRPFRPEDFASFADYHGDPEVYRFLYQDALSGEALREKFERTLVHKFQDDGDRLKFAVVVKEGDALVGEVILKLASRQAAQGENGYIFNPRFAGKGYATEALKVLVAFAFEALGFHRLFARLDAKNHGSKGVVERLGFRREAHLIENDCFNGTWGDEYIYAMLRREWRG